MMMAASRHHVREAVASALRLLGKLPQREGVDVVEVLFRFVRYVTETQDREVARWFGEELRRQVPGPGGDVMRTYAEELLREGRQEGREEGRQEGRQEGRIGTIESLLRVGVEWSTIEAATGIGPEAFRALKRRLEEAESGTAAG